MGFEVSTMFSVPMYSADDSYIYVLEPVSDYKDWLDEHFYKIAKHLKKDAYIIRGFDEKLTNEIFEFLKKNGADIQSQLLESIFSLSVSILISNGPIHKTKLPFYIFPLSFKELSVRNKNKLLNTIFDDVVFAVNRHDDDLLHNYGFKICKLKKSGLTVWISNFKYINKRIELKPKIAGVGIDFNGLIDDMINRLEKT